MKTVKILLYCDGTEGQDRRLLPIVRWVAALSAFSCGKVPRCTSSEVVVARDWVTSRWSRGIRLGAPNTRDVVPGHIMVGLKTTICVPTAGLVRHALCPRLCLRTRLRVVGRCSRLLNVQSAPPVMGACVIVTSEKCVTGSMGRAWSPNLWLVHEEKRRPWCVPVKVLMARGVVLWPIAGCEAIGHTMVGLLTTHARQSWRLPQPGGWLVCNGFDSAYDRVVLG